MKTIPRLLKSVTATWTTLQHWVFERWHGIAAAHGVSEPSYTGKHVDEVCALNCSTVYACARVISDPVGMCPTHLFERMEGDERRRATEDPLYRLLRYAPNKFTTAINFKQTVQMFALLWGNGYAQIIRRSGVKDGEAISFRLLHPKTVTPKAGNDGPVYEVSQGNGESPKILQFRDMLHIPGLGFDGISGQSVIRFAANTIGLDLAALQYGGAFFAKGGRVPYLLKLAKRFETVEKKEQFRSDWEKTYSVAHTAPILEGDVDYQQIGFKPEESQLLGTRLFSVQEICRWFLVNPYKVGDGRHATMNNVEHLGIEFLQTCLGYWLETWCQQIWLRVFTERQREKFYVEFDQNTLLKGDFKTRMEGYAVAKQNGWMCADQICARENLPKLPNGAGGAYYIQGASVVVPGTGEPTSFERAQLARAANGKKPSAT